MIAPTKAATPITSGVLNTVPPWSSRASASIQARKAAQPPTTAL